MPEDEEPADLRDEHGRDEKCETCSPVIVHDDPSVRFVLTCRKDVSEADPRLARSATCGAGMESGAAPVVFSAKRIL